MKKEKHQYQLRKVPYPKMKREVWQEKKNPRVFLRGQMYWACLEGKNGNLTKCRPVVILSNNKCNQHGEDLTVVPITSSDKKEWLPTHVKIMVRTQAYWTRRSASISPRCRKKRLATTSGR